MMGKIVGVALVGLTQFALWVIFTLIIVSGFLSVYSTDISKFKQSQLQMQTESIVPMEDMSQDSNVNESVIAVFESIQSINFPVMIGSFLFFFLGGYLLYASLFAAIGAAVDSETDTQQFMLPVTIPLILSLVLAQVIITNPDGPIAFWLSIIPLTSPIIMMIRIPFGVPFIDLFLSFTLLILGFISSTWIAAKIYRTGILIYGKKVNYRELWKWLKYKN